MPGVRVIGYRCAQWTNALLLLCELVQPPWTTVGSFLKELNMHLPCKPAILLLGICPVESMMRNICVQASPKPQKPFPDHNWEPCHPLFRGLWTRAETGGAGPAHVHPDVSTWTAAKHRGVGPAKVGKSCVNNFQGEGEDHLRTSPAVKVICPPSWKL